MKIVDRTEHKELVKDLQENYEKPTQVFYREALDTYYIVDPSLAGGPYDALNLSRAVEVSDLKNYLQLLDDFGIKYTQERMANPYGNVIPNETEMIMVTIDKGIGYSGFECDFFFTLLGKFLTHGVWE